MIISGMLIILVIILGTFKFFMTELEFIKDRNEKLMNNVFALEKEIY